MSKLIPPGLAAAAIALLAAGCAPPPPPEPVTIIELQVDMGVKYCNHCYASQITAASTRVVDVVRRSLDRPQTGWRTAKETVVVTAEQFAAFKARLAPLRPTGDRVTVGSDDCGDQLLEQDTVTVTWTEGTRKDSLTHSFNCVSPRALEITEILLAAPGDLGVKIEVQPPAPLQAVAALD